MAVSYNFEQIEEKLNKEFSKASRLTDGIRYLKIRTLVDREALKLSGVLKKFLNENHIKFEKVNVAEIVKIRKALYEGNIKDTLLDDIIKRVYKELSASINYESLKSNLRKVAEMGDSYWHGWNSVYRDNIRDHVQHHFVRNISIQNFDDLVQKINHELFPVVKGYTIISWFNQWTSTIIEKMFMEHPQVIPTVRRIEKVDFFFLNIPFDLKVTFLPDQYIREKKKEIGTNSDEDVVEHVKEKPMDLAVWLYENQGEPRFSDSNRIFIVLIDESDIDKSWKLKAEFDLINEKVNQYLNERTSVPEVEWKFEGEKIRGNFKTFSDVILITVGYEKTSKQVKLFEKS